MNHQLLIGLLLCAPLFVGDAKAQTPADLYAPTLAASSSRAPKTALSRIKNDSLKEIEISGSAPNQLFYLHDGENKNFARSTLVVVPAEGANDLLKLQTNAITKLSQRLQVIEDRLEKLEKNKELKK